MIHQHNTSTLASSISSWSVWPFTDAAAASLTGNVARQTVSTGPLLNRRSSCPGKYWIGPIQFLLDRAFFTRTIRTMGGLFIPWTIRPMDYSYVGLFVRWTFRTTDYSYYGLFVPFINTTYANKANVYMCLVCLTVNIVYMYWSDISVTDNQCSLSIFRANKMCSFCQVIIAMLDTVLQ